MCTRHSKQYCRILQYFTFLILIFMTGNAQVPQLINYQGRLTDDIGNPLSGDYQITFRIYYHLEEGGDQVWTETHPAITVTNGLFNVMLGSITSLPDNCFSDDTTSMLGITIGSDGTDELEPRTRLITVPYAYQALRSDTAYYAIATSAGNCGWELTDDMVHLADESDSVTVGGIAFSAKMNILDEGNDIALPNLALGVMALNPVGDATAGWFWADGDAGKAHALKAYSSSSGSDTAFSIYGKATNYGAGPAIGIFGEAPQYGDNGKIGVRGHASTTNIGDVYGGYFTASGTGSIYATHTALYANSDATSGGTIFGLICKSRNLGSGPATAGYFEANYDGSGDKYGLSILSQNYNNGETYGISTYVYNTGTADVYGFDTDVQSVTSGDIFGSYMDVNGGSGTFVEGYTAFVTAATNGSVTAVHGQATNNGAGNTYGGSFRANSGGSGTHYGVWGSETAGGTGAAVYAAGDFVASGTKSAVMRTSKGTTLMYALEASEVWFEDFGEGQMVNGSAHIELDPIFLEMVTVNPNNPMRVFIQLNDDCNGTYVKTSATGFSVYELRGGQSNASFSYRIVAKRKGYESERMRNAVVGYDDPHLYPERADEIFEKMMKKEPADAD